MFGNTIITRQPAIAFFLKFSFIRIFFCRIIVSVKSRNVKLTDKCSQMPDLQQYLSLGFFFFKQAAALYKPLQINHGYQVKGWISFKNIQLREGRWIPRGRWRGMTWCQNMRARGDVSNLRVSEFLICSMFSSWL